jgi:4-diphosphocytidyl-2C-methyl-D-erythritol kinase
LEDARAMKLRADAKVNLHLRVRGRRADGFHEIER